MTAMKSCDIRSMVSSAGQFLVRLRAMDHLCLPSKHHPQPKHQLSHQHHVTIFIVVTGRILPTVNRPLDEFCFVICQNLKIVLKSDLLLFHFDLTHSHLFSETLRFRRSARAQPSKSLSSPRIVFSVAKLL